jgi:pimeloyl-ACP methyl ester carboxylesterase
MSGSTMTATVDGGALEFDVGGDVGRPAVVFLHPGLWDRRTWDGHFERYGRRYRVVRYDARGYGRSSRPEPGRPYSHVDDLIAVLDAAGVDRAALIGCSMGGATAVETAAEHPSRVAALVLAAPGINGWDDLTREETADLDARFAPVEAAIDRGDLPAARDAQLAIFAPLGTDDAAGRRIREIAFDNLHEVTMDESGRRDIDPPIVDRLASITAPALVIAAGHDPPVYRRVARIYADGIPGARLVEVADTDHVVNVRTPGAFDAAVLPFLEQTLG